MRTSILRAPLLVAAITLLLASTAIASPSASGGGSAKVAYNAIPSKVAGNVPSVGFEATSTTEFGDEVGLAGSARTLQSMSVLFSSWGCENGTWIGEDCSTTAGASFLVPMTFKIYEDLGAGARGDLLASQTQTVSFLYRPSADSRCTGGRWYNAKDRTCYNGLAQTIKMSFASGLTLTDNVIWTVEYNTTHWGPAPIGEGAACFVEPGGCGYDSLNVGTFSFASAPYAGTDTNADEVFRNGATETGWTGYRPLGAISTR
jgi:hypothetical protein